LLWTVGIVAELVLVVLAYIGYQKIRDDIRRRDTGYVPDVWPMDGAYERRQPAPPPAQIATAAPALAPAARPLLRLPPPKPKRPLPSYLRVAVDNGSVPAYRSQANFAAKGKLRSVPRSVAGYIGW
jgi:hypothetical protein